MMRFSGQTSTFKPVDQPGVDKSGIPMPAHGTTTKCFLEINPDGTFKSSEHFSMSARERAAEGITTEGTWTKDDTTFVFTVTKYERRAMPNRSKPDGNGRTFNVTESEIASGKLKSFFKGYEMMKEGDPEVVAATADAPAARDS